MSFKKLFLIAIKDLRLIFRDRSALIFMLLAPFALTMGMGALTGRFSGATNSGFSDIPLVIINQDEGVLGKALVEVFQSPELEQLLAPELIKDLAAAKNMVDTNQVAGLIRVPDGFSDSIIPSTDPSSTTKTVMIEFYANPTQPTSAGVLQSILEQFINQVEIGRVSGSVIVSQLLQNGLINPDQAAGIGLQIGQEMAEISSKTSSVKIKTETIRGEEVEFDILAYLAPGMAMMFLMFTVTYGGRSLLLENRTGTLPRMLVSPTPTAYVIAGKTLGIFLTAVAQPAILIGGTSLLFSLEWGDPLGVICLILAAAFGASGWGSFFASVLKTPGQVAVTGSAVMLVFGLLGGSFFDLSMLPDWVNFINKVTPNSWANNGFLILGSGGKIVHILPNLLALLIMGVLLFSLGAFLMRKRGLAGK